MGGVCARGSGSIGGVDVCVRGWAAVLGVNNSDDFPNLARSRMWMAALERNCDGFIWLPVCFFIGRREEEWQKGKGGRGGVGEWRQWRSLPRRTSEEVQSKLFYTPHKPEFLPSLLSTSAFTLPKHLPGKLITILAVLKSQLPLGSVSPIA